MRLDNSRISAHVADVEVWSAIDIAAVAVGGILVLSGLALLFLRPSNALIQKLKRWAAPIVGIGVIVAVFAPGVLTESPVCERPLTDAEVMILSPSDGATLESSEVNVRVRITGGRLAETSRLQNVEGEGHLHLSLDGRLVSMTGDTDQTIQAEPGRHILVAEYVANDHAPFCTRVIDRSEFSVSG